ncbi:Uncharacterised protein [Salmonella enterica subsp. diarizonae]|nr:Uncharacterised protein [Salmonella enterica subsp. arizonae]VFS74282.1 Uncharacterised protein [Salmonella enterica subsp. diarizonae]
MNDLTLSGFGNECAICDLLSTYPAGFLNALFSPFHQL